MNLKYDHFIWLQTAFLGDMVLTSAAIDLAKQSFPEAKQVLLSTKMGQKALAGCAGLDLAFDFDKSQKNIFAIVRRLKERFAAQGIDLRKSLILRVHRSPRSALLTRLLGADTVTYRQSSLSFFSTYKVDRIAVWHEAQRIAILLEPFGVSREKIAAARPKLTAISAPGEKVWRQEMAAVVRPLVGLAPGSVWPTKRWPVEGFSELAVRLKKSGYGLVILGGANEVEYADAVVLELKKKCGDEGLNSVFNLAGISDFDDLRFVFPRLSLVVTNDSAPVHFASALDTPTLAIFGPTTAGMGFYPLASRSLSVGLEDLACRPCSVHGQALCPLGHFRCMRDLSVDRVFSDCLKLLGQS